MTLQEVNNEIGCLTKFFFWHYNKGLLYYRNKEKKYTVVIKPKDYISSIQQFNDLENHEIIQVLKGNTIIYKQ